MRQTRVEGIPSFRGTTMESARELRKFVAPEFVFGNGAARLAGRYVHNLGGTRCLVVTDPGVMRNGHADTVIGSLTAYGIAHAVFQDISPNPRDVEVQRGVEAYHREGCDAIVAVGGGSPIDCAKGIGIVASNGGSISLYEGVDAIPKPMPPLVCVPTTAGSAADVSQFAIITDTTRMVKIAIVSKAAVADVALIDPSTTKSMSRDLTAATGIDTLTHAIEAFASNASGPITDMFALEAISLVNTHLPQVLADGDDDTAREGMALACLNAGLAFSNAILGAVHAMAHSLGGLLDLPHGECNAILLPFVVRRNFDAAPVRYARVANALGIDVGGTPATAIRDALFDRLMTLRTAAGFTRGLSAFGVTREQIGRLARLAVEDPCLATNPEALDIADIESLYAEAL